MVTKGCLAKEEAGKKVENLAYKPLRGEKGSSDEKLYINKIKAKFTERGKKVIKATLGGDGN